MASPLSPRQRQILDLVAEGRTSKEIAVTLGISESTVNWHLANAFERLGASSRAEAVALSIRSNGADRVAQPPARVAIAMARVGWPRLVAIAVAIALAGALLGGVAVATFHLGSGGPVQAPTASPAKNSGAPATSTPASGTPEDMVGGDAGSDPAGASPPASPAILPVVTAPPLPSLPVVTAPPLPLPGLPLPIPTPTPVLPLP